MGKCKCGVGDVFYSHLHESGCPCETDPEMKAPPTQIEILESEIKSLRATVAKQGELLRRGHAILDGIAVETMRANELRCDLVDAGYLSTENGQDE